MRNLIWIALSLALAGCGTGSGGYSSGNSDGEDAATMMLLGGTAFLNGYNQRPAALTCFHYGGIMTQCQ